MKNILSMTDQKEYQVEGASQKYFNLFIKDWANMNQLDMNTQNQLKEILKDAYSFTEVYLEEEEEEISFDSELMSAV